MRLLSSLAISFAVTVQFVSGAPFLNLGFDDARTNQIVSGGADYAWGKAEDFLPAWQLVYGTRPILLIGVGNTLPALGDATLVPGEGGFALNLLPSSQLRFILSQTGDVPPGAKMIHFLTRGLNVSPGAHFTLAVNDFPVSLTYEKRPSPEWIEDNDVYADISGFAGQAVKLTLTTILSDAPTGYTIDSISFAIPEPPPLLLALIPLTAILCGARANPALNRAAARKTWSNSTPLGRRCRLPWC